MSQALHIRNGSLIDGNGVPPVVHTDVLVVDGDRATDVTILQDRSNLRGVISRGALVDLGGPWPERRRFRGEKVAIWSGEVLTYERAVGTAVEA